MKWSKTPPTVPGWFWYRNDEEPRSAGVPIRVEWDADRCSVYFPDSGRWDIDELATAEWAGPIEQPKGGN